MPRFDQSFTGLCEQNLQDTQLLKQRFLDAKVKRPPKAKEKAAKQQEAANAAASGSIQSSVHVQQKFLKRPAEDHDPGGSDQQTGENFEPPVKLQCTAQQHNSHQNDQGLTKFSVEIVQQLEFTTSAANSQPQQISTNVTVKTHANASVKSDVSSPKSNPSTPASGVAGMHQKSNIGLETLVECVKQEPDNDFADLDQCAAALEKDAAANGGAGFGGFSDLIGDDTNDEIISSATFNDLISDISNYPDYELMKDFDFEDKSESNSNIMKVEDNKDLLQNVDNTNKTTHSPLLQNQNNYSPPVFENQTIKNRLPGYSNMDFTKTELSPAAQTLKHMAEQHQHQKQMGLSFNPSTRTPNSRSPYPDFQFQGDYGSPNSNSNFHKNSPTFPQPDMIKQEMIFQGNEFDIKRKTSSAAAAAAANMYNPQQQQYSPYGSPGGGHGSPGYLPRGAAPPGQGQFGGGTPPRPPSGPGQGNGNSNGPSVQINQAQQLNVSQQGHGHSIQVSAGQHVHLSGDLKGNVSIAAQQGMHFQHNSNSNQPQGTNNGNHHTHNQQSSPMSAPQHQGSPMGGGMGGQMGGMMPNAQQMGQQQQGMQSGLSGSNGGLGSNINMGGPLGSMAGPNNGLGSNGMGPNSGMGPSGGMGGPGGIPSGMGNMHPGMQHVGGMGHQNDSYSLSQTQTINFTQQSLRRSSGPGVPNMGGNGPGSNLPSMPGQQQAGGMGGPRLLSAQSLEQQQQQQKLLHQQQQMLRAQQQYMAATRPPPPEYKASAAGMIQSGMQPRYAGAPGGPPPVMRRVGGGHQPMPPSGPMIRSNMYMLQQQQQHQQQQMPQRASLYSRQQGPMGVGIESVQQHSQAEWRHLLMTQQQNGGFNTMRPNFQQGFNLNSGSMHQMTALQHQQIRMSVHQQQQGMGGQPQPQSMNTQNQLMVQGGGGGPMAQMNNMNQAVLHMQQQQQQQQQQHSLVQQQQQNSHMSLSNIHMQQSQSISVTNQSIQQQNNLAEQLGNATSNNQNNALSNFNPQADFNFEFLDNLGAGDSTAFTDQELLNSFDSDAGFNLDF